MEQCLTDKLHVDFLINHLQQHRDSAQVEAMIQFDTMELLVPGVHSLTLLSQEEFTRLLKIIRGKIICKKNNAEENSIMIMLLLDSFTCLIVNSTLHTAFRFKSTHKIFNIMSDMLYELSCYQTVLSKDDPRLEVTYKMLDRCAARIEQVKEYQKFCVIIDKTKQKIQLHHCQEQIAEDIVFYAENMNGNQKKEIKPKKTSKPDKALDKITLIDTSKLLDTIISHKTNSVKTKSNVLVTNNNQSETKSVKNAFELLMKNRKK